MPDGYFGNIGNSFYAGPNGASFQIKAEFGNYRELLANQNSSILVGDYLVVNYGSQATPNDPTGPNNKSYNTNKAIDAYNGTGDDPETDNPKPVQLQHPGYYNATLWQRVNNTNSAADYSLVFQSVSAAPDIDITTSETHVAPGASIGTSVIDKDQTSAGTDLQRFTLKPIDPWNIEKGQGLGSNGSDFTGAGATPTITLDRKSTPGASDSDTTKYLHFGIPNAWDLELGTTTPVNAGSPPVIGIANSASHPTTHKAISIQVPRAWEVEVGSTVSAYPGTGPTVSLNQKDNPSSSDSTTTKYLHFGLPDVWNLEVQSENIGTWATPTATITDSTTNPNTHKLLKLSLPQAADFNRPSVNLIDPEPTTEASIDRSVVGDHTLHLDFNLPRGARIFCGALLDTYQKTVVTQPVTITNSALSSLLVGDLYISPKYSTIWKVTAVTKNGSTWQSCTLQQQGVGQVPFPILDLETISPNYVNGVSQATPSITYNYTTDPPIATIPIVGAPDIVATNVGVVPPNDTNQGVSITASGSTITVKARIPRGPGITDGDLNKFNAEQKDYPHSKGDYFFRSDQYILYRYTDDSNNVEQVAYLKGENISFKGDPIPVDDSDLTGYTGDLITQISLYLKATLQNDEKPEPDRELVVVIYEEKDTSVPPQVVQTITYWFYRRVNTLGEESYYGFQVSSLAGGGIILSSDQYDPAVIDSVNNGDSVVFSANGILSLKHSLTATIATKAPIVHAASTTIYGPGDAENYGHVMLSDTYTIPSAASSGVAITSKGVYDALTWGSWEVTSNTYSIKKGSVTIETGSITV